MQACRPPFLTSAFPVELVKGFQHLLGARADGSVFGQVSPANRAFGINEEFSRTRDVFTSRSGAGVQQIVPLHHSGLRIGEKRKGEAHLLAMPLIGVFRVDADRGDANASRIKVRQPPLKTPQLGVTEWSPMSAVKN
jgi:hypothetical protein